MGLRTLMCLGLCSGAALLPTVGLAQDDGEARQLGTEVIYSHDSDDTTVVIAGVDFDLRNDGSGKRLGVRLENARYEPAGERMEQRQRVFLQAGDRAGKWTWMARIGGDGDSLIGSASVHDDAKFRKEAFIERDIVETRQGIDRGIYSTFVGAALDIPFDERNVLTALVGVQEFTGKNVRVHLRGNYIHVVKSEWGLSAQLRGRYFRSSDPGEFDYYSPRYYGQVLPAVQVRRFVEGWRLRAVGGIGVQRDSTTRWKRASFAQFGIDSPSGPHDWKFGMELTYTDTPSTEAQQADGYHYLQSRVSLAHRF